MRKKCAIHEKIVRIIEKNLINKRGITQYMRKKCATL